MATLIKNVVCMKIFKRVVLKYDPRYTNTAVIMWRYLRVNRPCDSPHSVCVHLIVTVWKSHLRMLDANNISIKLSGKKEKRNRGYRNFGGKSLVNLRNRKNFSVADIVGETKIGRKRLQKYSEFWRVWHVVCFVLKRYHHSSYYVRNGLSGLKVKADNFRS